MTLSWYAAKTKPQREETAFASLVEQGFAAVLPRAHTVRHHHRSKAEIHDLRPLFTGYVFVGFPPGREHFGFARRCDGMGSFVGFNGRPERFPSSFIADLSEACFVGEMSDVMRERRRRAVRVRQGDMVEIVGGVYANKGGVIAKLFGKNKAVVQIEGLLGVMSEVKMDVSKLRAA